MTTLSKSGSVNIFFETSIFYGKHRFGISAILIPDPSCKNQIGALSILLGLFLMIAGVVLLFTQNPAAVAVISTWVELGILSFLASKINSGSKK